MSSFILSAQTEFDAAVAAASTGKVDMGVFVEWCKQTPIDPLKYAALVSVCPADFGAIMQAQQAIVKAAAVSAAQPTGDLRLKVSKRGAISVYGLNSRMPVTLYAGQVERLVKWLNAPPSNPLTKFIAGNPSSVFAPSDFGESKADQDYLAEVLAGKHPHAKAIGQQIHVHLSRKS